MKKSCYPPCLEKVFTFSDSESFIQIFIPALGAEGEAHSIFPVPFPALLALLARPGTRR